MRRRRFLKKIPIAASTPVLLNNIPVNVMAGNSHLKRLAMMNDTDKVIVLIQLHGGNDGLNTLIPVAQYDEYVSLRPNIAIPSIGSKANRRAIALDNRLDEVRQIGLHPDMTGIKDLYDQGKVSVIQSVGYENINQSHFRSRDIWYMGGGYDDYLNSGWAGRYLETEYPAFPDGLPNAEMPDPLALEFGSNVNLIFHTEFGDGVPAGFPIGEDFAALGAIETAFPPDNLNDTYYARELRYILDIQEQANQYADRLEQVYENGTNSGTTYPERYPLIASGRFSRNGLAGQLKTVARLLSGGVKTRIFLTKIFGFDTHADQVTAHDATMGAHSALLYHISSAVKAFQDDLAALGLEDRVLTMTFSEFGRRAASNGSYGTDHGTAAPMLVFGKGVNPGVLGDSPNLNELTRGANLQIAVDYRSVFKEALRDWMGASDAAMQATLFNDLPDLLQPLIGSRITSTENTFVEDRFRLNNAYPNPAQHQTTISYYINNSGHVKLALYNTMGKKIKELVNEKKNFGEHRVLVDLSKVPAGSYIYKIETGQLKVAKKLMVVN